MTLFNCQIQVQQSHGTASGDDIHKVLTSMRFSALRGIKLRSSRQPPGIFVKNIRPDDPDCYAPMTVKVVRDDGAATIWVTIDETHWARLAYQFGHELGHVVANSWADDAITAAPCQWIEEVCVEAFSLRAMFEISKRWTIKPPYLQWMSYASHFVDYAEETLRRYCELPRPTNADLDQLVNLSEPAKALVPAIAKAFFADRRLIEDIAALNRWPGRSSIPFDDYLVFWRASCAEIGTPGRLPELIAVTRPQ